VPTTSTVKKYTAYIQQQDCFFGGATVAETILFAAMCKLPGSTAADVADKQAKVLEVINHLNLGRCSDTYMGNRLIRGVSGGEMKRTAVACALLSAPQCMFLDEPTSGLDSAMAHEVIVNLHALQVP
jgi:ABC-type multidrug transport system ATPase subunit